MRIKTFESYSYPFKQGQRVLALTDSKPGAHIKRKKGEIYTIINYYSCSNCKTHYLNFGEKIDKFSVKKDGTCVSCGNYLNNFGHYWTLADNYISLDSESIHSAMLDAVSDEDYELAVILRDMLKEPVYESLPRKSSVKQLNKLRKLAKGTDIGDRISDMNKQGANISYIQNPIDTGIESYEDFEKKNKKFKPSWNVKGTKIYESIDLENIEFTREVTYKLEKNFLETDEINQIDEILLDLTDIIDPDDKRIYYWSYYKDIGYSYYSLNNIMRVDAHGVVTYSNAHSRELRYALNKDTIKTKLVYRFNLDNFRRIFDNKSSFLPINDIMDRLNSNGFETKFSESKISNNIYLIVMFDIKSSDILKNIEK